MTFEDSWKRFTDRYPTLKTHPPAYKEMAEWFYNRGEEEASVTAKDIVATTTLIIGQEPTNAELN